jgi:hypothetical protein
MATIVVPYVWGTKQPTNNLFLTVTRLHCRAFQYVSDNATSIVLLTWRINSTTKVRNNAAQRDTVAIADLLSDPCTGSGSYQYITQYTQHTPACQGTFRKYRTKNTPCQAPRRLHHNLRSALQALTRFAAAGGGGVRPAARAAAGRGSPGA